MIKEIIEYILSFLKSRILPMVIIFIVLFVVLINRLFNLQIVNGESFVQDVSKSIQKNTSVAATRGRIFDRNGVLLAYNQLAYSVKISDSGTYASRTVKNNTINEAINKTIEIIKKNGDKINNDFPIVIDESGQYQFTVTDTTRLRFLRDIYGTTSVNNLTDEQKNSTATQVVEYLISSDKYGVSLDYSRENILEILNLRRYMSANSYNRYMTFTIAYEVSDKTVASILENSEELTGIVIEQEYVRRYVDSVYISNILGYTGTVSTSELAENSKFEANDVVGKAGIEQSLDSDLQGTKGSKTLYVDTVGRITQVLDETEPVTGNDVYLTIDINLQKRIYNEIENKLVEILLSKIVDNDTTITYNSDGTISDIYIPIKSVYFALIDNNIISLNTIAKKNSPEESAAYDTFQNKLSQVVPTIQSELTNNSTVYSKLSDELKDYESYIETMLKNNQILNDDNIDKSDGTYLKWEAGTCSIQEFLTYAITKNWINMSNLTSEQYSSLQEGYNSLVNYIVNKLQVDNGFHKKLYKYLINSGAVTGKQVCLMLFDQGILVRNEADYAALNSGSLSASAFIRAKITNKEITPGQLALKPCSGSAVVTDPNSGDVLALVSYPGYDNNKLSGKVDADYYNQLNNDLSTPLYDKATAAQSAPGSIFKPITAITALETGIITPSQTIYCSGVFDLVTPAPRCWQKWGHGSENVSTAIRDSCDVFFYDVGYRLAMEPGGKYNSLKGTSAMQKYAEEVGLATKANIEIYERTPQASNITSITSAIGQGNHLYSALNMARYVSTLATSGVCHNLTLVDKVTDHSGNLVRDNSAAVANVMNVSTSTWNAVHSGMRMVIQNAAYFNSIPIAIAGKSGTAQEKTTEPDHTTYISYAPYDDPKVAMAVVIQNGYVSANVGALTAELYKIYYGLK